MAAAATLSALYPAVPLQLGGERVQLRPVVLSELPAVEQVLEGWRVLIATRGEVLPQEAWDTFLDLLAAAVGRTSLWVRQLPEEDLERLICHALAVNAELFEPAGEAKANISWGELVAKLVAAGHSRESVGEMTLAQAQIFLAEAYRLDRESLAFAITASSFSMADPKATERTVKRLHHG